MVTDKNTLLLLSRLADAQLALAESMRGVTPSDPCYPATALERVAEGLTLVEVAVLEITKCTPNNGANGQAGLH